MCLKWDFSGIEGNYETICKQLQIRIISENIFSLILIVYRHRKLGSPEMNFVAYKRNLIKRALATVQYKKTVPTAESYPIKI